MDGEQVRALLAARLWAAGTATERVKKTPADWLPIANDLLLRSYGMGAPVSPEAVLYLDPANSAFAVQRFREWLQIQSPETQQMFAQVFPL